MRLLQTQLKNEPSDKQEGGTGVHCL